MCSLYCVSVCYCVCGVCLWKMMKLIFFGPGSSGCCSLSLCIPYPIPVVLRLRAHSIPSYSVRGKQESLVQLSEVQGNLRRNGGGVICESP